MFIEHEENFTVISLDCSYHSTVISLDCSYHSNVIRRGGTIIMILSRKMHQVQYNLYDFAFG